ncbi:hypothetical protein B0H21DRAFT_699739 [Amylocystis lapponica]|nr:hypothetical protein B0H21DRAFT_699739 [Amylocystis lapponica]
MAQFFAAPSNGNQFLHPPAPPSRKATQRKTSMTRNEFDDFLSSDADRDLEITFASTMSLHSPPQDLLSLSPENQDPSCVPMDISPAPPQRHNAVAKPIAGRPRAFTSAARLFGRDMSNQHGNNSVTSLASVAKSGTGSTSGKRLQRSALPFEWMAPAGQNQNDSGMQQQNIPPSPAASDAMEIDTSFVYVPSTTVHIPLSAAPTITAFNFNDNPMSAPVSATPTVGTFNLFFSSGSPPRAASADLTELSHEASQVSESPVQPITKKRRSSSPAPASLRRAYEHLAHEEPSFDSSPAQSSPSEHKLERLSGAQFARKPMLAGLGAPLALNANKKRPRRPALSAMVPPGDGFVDKPRSANPLPTGRTSGDKENAMRPPAMPPVRRAFSAMLPPNTLEQSMSSEDASFGDDADMSSPAQAYAHRQQVKTIRRCDGTDDFRPLTGATALVRRDSDVLGRGLRRTEDREDRGRERVERDTPRSKYLGTDSGLGGFGDNEALGKILPCHRVREDGLMRITCKTLDALLDGVYDSQLASFVVIDCRFDYEYNGGHVPGAMNINTTAGVEEFLLGENAIKPMPSTSGDPNKKTVLIFHCEFSVKRAPTFAKHLRSKDRALNNHVYPKIHFPEVYILEGGYSQYFSESGPRCQPAGYVRMDDPYYAASRKEDLDQFRKAKFGRTKSYAYGEGKMASHASREAKRNTAPSGTNTLFAAANAARTRRGAMQMLPEDNAHQSEDEDTDIGDSPCPPPTKGVTFKGKKIGRLAKAETYGPSRMMGVGY